MDHNFYEMEVPEREVPTKKSLFLSLNLDQNNDKWRFFLIYFYKNFKKCKF